MQANDIIDQRQTQSGSTTLPGFKPLKDPGLFFRINPVSVIGNPECGFIIINVSAKFDPAIFIRVVNDRLGGVPIAVTYEITEFGRSALVILEQLLAWAEENEI